MLFYTDFTEFVLFLYVWVVTCENFDLAGWDAVKWSMTRIMPSA